MWWDAPGWADYINVGFRVVMDAVGLPPEFLRGAGWIPTLWRGG